MAERQYQVIDSNVLIGEGAKTDDFVKLSGCFIGVDTRILSFAVIQAGVKIGKKALICSHTNLYGNTTIGDETTIGTNVEIQKGVVIGDRCKIQSHTFICEGVTIGNGVFVGHGVMFINDNHPRAVTDSGEKETDTDWQDRLVKTVVEDQVSIGTGAIIRGDVRIGKGAVVGAGAVVLEDVPPGKTVVGVPARILVKKIDQRF